jgi:starch phosphorylase
MLYKLISLKLGQDFVVNLDELKKLEGCLEDKLFIESWAEIKRENKIKLKEYILKNNGITVDENSIFDVHVKRFHEYKRQLLNVLHVITLYNRIKENPGIKVVPRTVIFGGKAAPGYGTAKLIIRLINSVANKVNSHPVVSKYLKVVFMENYSVSLAEIIIPAADLSEQISTAGYEASGTGNMKFALNGALTIGTMDGANVEMADSIGEENMFIFGLRADEVKKLKRAGYNPQEYYNENVELKKVLDMIRDGYFSESNAALFKPLYDSLVYYGDTYMLLADYEDYVKTQGRVSELYLDNELWTKKAIINAARMGYFSSDRTVKEYAEEIWGIKPVRIEI